MKTHNILLIGSFALLFIGFVSMGNGAVETGIFMMLIAIFGMLVAYRLWVSMVLRHDVIQVSTKYSPVDILRAAEEAFVAAKWQNAAGPGEINYMWKALGGLIAGPVLSVAIHEKYDNTYELDVWMSNYSTDKRGAPKNAGQIIKMKERVLAAVAKYAE